MENLWFKFKSWFGITKPTPEEVPVLLQHKHVLINMRVKKCPSKDDIPFMEEWFKNLISALGMKLLSGPHIKYVAVPGNKGLTGVCIIETSHIAMHCWEEVSPGLIQLDIYTCGAMDLSAVFQALEWFGPVEGTYKYLDRETGFVELENGPIGDSNV
jgi:S-adenosylmethionine/arginine decarboxylase-like enzyme